MDNLDTELLSLISRLNKIQTEFGGGKGPSLSAIVDETGKVDKFLDLRAQMHDILAGLRQKMDFSNELETNRSNPRELIAVQSQIRSDLSKLSDDWELLDSMYKKEIKKKKV